VTKLAREAVQQIRARRCLLHKLVGVVIGPETRRVAKGGLVIEESSNRAMASRSVARGVMVKCNSCLSP
jgi:hypothetical protein